MGISNHLSELGLYYYFKEYLLVINPSTTVSRDVGSIKRQYNRLFGKSRRLWSKPYISLCNFILAEYLEDKLKDELSDFLKEQKAFKVKPDGFRSFGNNKLLSAQSEKEGINRLQCDMLAVLRNRVRVGRSFVRKLREPQLSVALAYNDRQYQQAWDHFGKMNFKSSLLIDRITVMSRPYKHGSPERWTRVFELPLKQG